MTEIWRQITGYEGLYEVSSFGRVRNVRSGRILRPGLHHSGYLNCVLSVKGNRNTFVIHRLVAEAFIPNPDCLPQVNHKDENKTNNNVDNLEWCTSKYNINYGTARDRAIDTMIKNGNCTGLSQKEVKKIYYHKNLEKFREIRYNRKGYTKDYNHKYYMEHKEERRLYMRDYQRKHKKTT